MPSGANFNIAPIPTLPSQALVPSNDDTIDPSLLAPYTTFTESTFLLPSVPMPTANLPPEHISNWPDPRNTNLYVLIAESDVSQYMAPAEEAKKWQCCICGFIGARKDHTKRHILSKHAKAKSHFCSQCSTPFTRLDDLARHMNAVHSTSGDTKETNPHKSKNQTSEEQSTTQEV